MVALLGLELAYLLLNGKW